MTLDRWSRLAGTLLPAVGLMLWMGGCGSSPSQPTAPTPPAPTPPAANNAPVIAGIQVNHDRVEIDEDVMVTAAVSDAETPADQLAYKWTADAGTFTGTGRTVTWRAPKDSNTPHDYTMRLEVTEQYGTPDASGQRQQHVVSASGPPVRVHDSPRENGELAIRFLTDFANSSVPPQVALREFARSCEQGHDQEYTDIENNRTKFLILSSRLRLGRVNVAGSRVTADISVACSFESKRLACLADDPPGCKVGEIGSGSGDCRLTSVYEEQKWQLCTSNYVPDPASSRSMIGFSGR